MGSFLDDIRQKKREKEFKLDLIKKVRIVLAKIVEVYPKMEGNYIEKDGLKLVKDSKGNIKGMMDRLAFSSDDQGNILFYTWPSYIENSFYHGGMHDDYGSWYYEYEKIVAELGLFRKYRIYNVETITKCISDGWGAPSSDKEYAVKSKLEYYKIEREVESAKKTIKL